ncbi:MAG: phosphoribosylanthranilate isomerase [Oculatellaceae cyanobacterium Prado106]|jgi:phosphoribosylanthranilate isomerase|nr:phosphoribosylanthranilate isomerase [Oculatellaceae cyanobacterium Prado106]
MRVKICGITQPDQGRAIANLGATALGFICVPQSPRYVRPEGIRAIVTDQPVERVGVFVDAPVEEIASVVAIGNLTAVQLHGSESPHFCQQVRQALPQVALMKAFRVRDRQTLQETLSYTSIVDTLLLDAYHPGSLNPGQYGGTGHQIDWPTLQAFQPDCAWFLAGGITPDNILEALSLLQPDGVDLSSGVESAPGDKDLGKVATLFERLRAIAS